jgi:hypothetical protein
MSFRELFHKVGIHDYNEQPKEVSPLHTSDKMPGFALRTGIKPCVHSGCKEELPVEQCIRIIAELEDTSSMFSPWVRSSAKRVEEINALPILTRSI